MKKIALALACFASMSTFAASPVPCSVMLYPDDVGTGKSYGPAELAALANQGYSVRMFDGQGFDFNEYITTITVGSTCTKFLFVNKCKYSVQLTHMSGSSMNLDYPVYGKSLKAALAKLPVCN